MITFKFKKFIKELNSVSLSIEEQEELRTDFLQKTGLHDFSKPSLIQGMFLVRYSKVLVYSLLIFVTAITPFTFAAEYSQPGDALYPLKVSFNEPIKEAVKHVSYPSGHTPKEEKELQIKHDVEIKRLLDEHIKNNPQLNSKKLDLSSSKKKFIKKRNIPAKKIIKQEVLPVIEDANIEVIEETSKKIDEVERGPNTIKDQVDEVESTIKKNKKDLEKTNPVERDPVTDEVIKKIDISI